MSGENNYKIIDFQTIGSKDGYIIISFPAKYYPTFFKIKTRKNVKAITDSLGNIKKSFEYLPKIENKREINIASTLGKGWVECAFDGLPLSITNSTSEKYGFIQVEIQVEDTYIICRNIHALPSKDAGNAIYGVFCDEDGNVINSFRTEDNQVKSISKVQLSVPPLTSRAYFNITSSDSVEIECVQEQSYDSTNGVTKSVKENIRENISYSTNDYGILRNGSNGSNIKYKHAEIPIKEGEKYILNGASFWNYPFFIFKKGDTVVSSYPSNYTSEDVILERNIEFTAPSDGTLVVNVNLDDTNVENGSTIEKIIGARYVNKLENRIVEYENCSEQLKEDSTLKVD